ncbi:MAG: class I SAM-dependent methyltransferase [Verrucomicrobiota bacterium]
MTNQSKLYAVDAFDYLSERERKHFWFRERNHLLSECASTWFPNHREYLEVGCGNGCVLEHFSTAFPDWNLTAIEYFDEGIRHANRRLGTAANIVKGDARDLSSFQDLDLIGCFDVLEHIQDDILVLEQIHQALKPGGGLLITVPQHRSLWSARDDYAGHKRRYSRAKLTQKLSNVGFHVEFASSFIFFLLPLMYASRRIAPSSASKSRNREFQLPDWLNELFATPVKAERALIRRKISLPAGGSLLIAARKPSS